MFRHFRDGFKKKIPHQPKETSVCAEMPVASHSPWCLRCVALVKFLDYLTYPPTSKSITSATEQRWLRDTVMECSGEETSLLQEVTLPVRDPQRTVAWILSQRIYVSDREANRRSRYIRLEKFGVRCWAGKSLAEVIGSQSWLHKELLLMLFLLPSLGKTTPQSQMFPRYYTFPVMTVWKIVFSLTILRGLH